MARRKEDEDGAAFRLLVSRALTVMVDPEDKQASAIGWGGIVCSESFKDKADATAALRRAVIAAAAEVTRRYCAPGVRPSDEPRVEPEPQLVGYDECRCILTRYCDGTCRPVFALPAVLERARTLYANSPGAYRGTTPLPWNRAPMQTRLEFIGRAKVEVGRAALGMKEDDASPCMRHHLVACAQCSFGAGEVPRG